MDTVSLYREMWNRIDRIFEIQSARVIEARQIVNQRFPLSGQLERAQIAIWAASTAGSVTDAIERYDSTLLKIKDMVPQHRGGATAQALAVEASTCDSAVESFLSVIEELKTHQTVPDKLMLALSVATGNRLPLEVRLARIADMDTKLSKANLSLGSGRQYALTKLSGLPDDDGELLDRFIAIYRKITAAGGRSYRDASIIAALLAPLDLPVDECCEKLNRIITQSDIKTPYGNPNSALGCSGALLASLPGDEVEKSRILKISYQRVGTIVESENQAASAMTFAAPVLQELMKINRDRRVAILGEEVAAMQAEILGTESLDDDVDGYSRMTEALKEMHALCQEGSELSDKFEIAGELRDFDQATGWDCSERREEKRLQEEKRERDRRRREREREEDERRARERRMRNWSW
jgi:hypothetical protein